MRSAGALLIAAVTLLISESGQAAWINGVWQGPWCSGQSIGWSWQENCTLPSLDVCRREVVSGNRGVCFPNPSWPGPAASAPHGKRKRR